MDMRELKEAIFTIINRDDPYKASKQLYLNNWCMAFLRLFGTGGIKRLPFFLDVLLNGECWEETDTIHRIKLNRRIAAKKIVQPESPRGIENPLDYLERYQVACWCCLDEDIVTLFYYCRLQIHRRAKNKAELRRLVTFLNKGNLSDPLMGYWSNMVIDCVSDMESGDKHLYEQGLDHALDMYTGYVEGIEWFYDKIKALPEYEMSAQKKHDIFMNATVRAAETKFTKHPEIFEFCVSQITVDNYPDLLKRDIHGDLDFGSLAALQDNLRFDIFQKLFDCFWPKDISEEKYHRYLTLLEVEAYSDYYVREASMLFIHIWEREGFDRHRAYVLEKEMKDFGYRGTLLVPFVKKNYMEPVWAVLNKASPDDLKVFMDCEKAAYICSALENEGDVDSLNKFLSYKSRAFQNQSTSTILIDLSAPTKAKKPRTM